MGFLVIIKRVFVKSAMCEDEAEARFLDDKEWKIVVKCESGGESSKSNGESSESRGDSRGDSGDSGESMGESSTESQITITFFALENDIDCLAHGYLATFLGFDFSGDFRRENNHIFVDSPLSKDEILTRLSQKDIIQSCEQISLNDKKIMRDSVIMPFNGSRAKITREILEANRDFFQNGELGESSEFFAPTRHCKSLRSKAKQSTNQTDFPYKVRILFGKSYETNAESFDTNPKNAIYKAIGKAFDCATESSLRGSDSDRSNPNNPNLLDCVIFLNFRTDIECLKILLLQKCTFIVCAGIPSFSVVRFAQKFGITLMAFTNNDFLILTHALRFES